MRILIEHIKAVEKLSLYIDATGGVVKRPSNMKGKIFYYALVLSGAGKVIPCLPVPEMLSNGHAVSDMSSFLQKWLYTFQKLFKRLPFKLETDFKYETAYLK